MKKLLLSLALALLMASTAWAASTQTLAMAAYDGFTVVEISWTAHTDGTYDNYSIPSNVLTALRGKYCFLAVTDPGTTAPTDNYDVALLDAYSCDVLGGALDNRDATASEQAVPIIGSTTGPRPIAGALTLTISNNSVNAATGKVAFFFSR